MADLEIAETLGCPLHIYEVRESVLKDYDAAKKEFRDTLNLTMLKPFGFIPAEEGIYYYSAVVTEDVLVNFPALPRVINKLRDISNDRHFDKVIESARSGKKVKRVARDFLKKKKLI